MGLFDNIGADKNSGHMTYTQEVKAFATVDLNSIFKEASKAATEWIGYANKFFSDLFGHSDCQDQDRVLYERMKDQIPGMIIVMVQLGWEDSTMLNAYNDQPTRADYGGRPLGAFPCNQGINPARALFTTLFGVRIQNSIHLDALDSGVDAYYQAAGGDWQIDIPREAVVRAVDLKQKYFPISTYNRQQWDMNQFQEHPLVAPIPDPFQKGKLWTGNIFGVDVVNGLVYGTPIPDLPTSTATPIVVTDPWHDIIFPKGGGSVPATTTTTPQSFIDKIISFVKANPKEAMIIAAGLGFIIYEIEENE